MRAQTARRPRQKGAGIAASPHVAARRCAGCRAARFGGRVGPRRQGRRASPFGHRGRNGREPRRALTHHRPRRPVGSSAGRTRPNFRRSPKAMRSTPPKRIRRLSPSSTSTSGRTPSSLDLQPTIVPLRTASLTRSIGPVRRAGPKPAAILPSPPVRHIGIPRDAVSPSFDLRPTRHPVGYHARDRRSAPISTAIIRVPPERHPQPAMDRTVTRRIDRSFGIPKDACAAISAQQVFDPILVSRHLVALSLTSDCHEH